ncbi:hypothetical protein CARUB_v10024161mg, partial [Capsella rubella]
GNSESCFRKYRIPRYETPRDLLEMRQGSCKESIKAWQDCYSEENFVRMRRCMEAHPHYYQPLLAPIEAGGEVFEKEMESFLMPSNEDSNQQKEEERQDALYLRFCKFMEGGDCKEIFTAFLHCVEEDDESSRCLEVKETMSKCIEAHSDYYQPYLAAKKAASEQICKELVAPFVKQA